MFSKKAAILSAAAFGIMLGILAVNAILNWNYFKQYSGPDDAGYKLAWGLQNGISYCMLIPVLVIVIHAGERVIIREDKA